MIEGLRTILEGHEILRAREHQLEGVRQLVMPKDEGRGRTVPNVFFLADEVGAGKTKQVVDAAQILFNWKQLDTVVVLAPGFACSTWNEQDPVLGEVAKHSWKTVRNVIHTYRGGYRIKDWDPADALHWVVASYEYVRQENRMDELVKDLQFRKVWLVCDESWALMRFSQQMRSVRRLRAQRADRVTLLNGTPLAEGKPIDLYYPFMILDEDIIGCPNKATFKARYCVTETVANVTPGQSKHANERIVGYKQLDELNKRVAPYVLSRRTRECWDLPPMLDPITVQVALTPTSWKFYRQMRDQMVVELGDKATVSKNGLVKVLRLAQITSGFLSGFEDLVAEEEKSDDALDAAVGPKKKLAPEPRLKGLDQQSANAPDWLKKMFPEHFTKEETDGTVASGGPVVGSGGDPVSGAPRSGASAEKSKAREIGREKQDGLMRFVEQLNPRPNKLLVWCRFRPELERATRELTKFYPTVLNLKGGQTKDERNEAKMLLAPDGDPRPGAVVGNQKAGGASLNFAASSMAIYLSNGPRLIERTQSIGRIERPGAKEPMRVVDIEATGPNGQKTLDHYALKALRAKEDMAQWTVDQWRKILRDLE